MSDRPSRMPLILMALAAGLVGGTLGALLFPPMQVEAPEQPGGGSQELQERITAQEQRLAELEQVVEQLATLAVRTGSTRESVDAAAARTQQLDVIRQLLERLDALEEAAAGQASTPTGSGILGGIPAIQDRVETSGADSAQQIRDAQTAILSSTEAQAKLAAWSRLRDLGPDAWSDPVVQEMVRVGQTHPDPDVRADVWRQADARARHPQMRDALVLAAGQDKDPKVRGEAAESLENYCKSPQVRSLLEQLATSDPSAEVRENANKALRKWQEDQEDEKKKR